MNQKESLLKGSGYGGSLQRSRLHIAGAASQNNPPQHARASSGALGDVVKFVNTEFKSKHFTVFDIVLFFKYHWSD